MFPDGETFLATGGGLLVVVGLFGLAAGMGYWNSSSVTDTRGSMSDKKLVEGRRLYMRHCRTCHGQSGRARGPASQYLSNPPLNFHSDTAARYSDEELFERITEGKPETGMPGWEGTLSEDERGAIVKFLQREFIDSPEEK